jgi:type VI secretion system secreted protein VgrG
MATGNNSSSDRSAAVAGNDSLSIGGNRAVTVGRNDLETVVTNKSVVVGKGLDVTVGQSMAVAAGKIMVLEAADEIEIVCGQARLSMKKDGTIVLSGRDITIIGSGAVKVKASGEVTLKGSKVNSN